MPQMRHNLITGEWVIIAEDRAKRPVDHAPRPGDQPPLPRHDPGCPFCPGNEEESPVETLRLPEVGPWQVRAVLNRFPALRTDGDAIREGVGYSRTVQGVGRHEVIVEGPEHNRPMALLPENHTALVLEAYRQRMLTFYADPRVEHVIVFRNHGEAAGTSLVHPHSQIVGTPVVPGQVRARIEEALRYFSDYGSCVFCHGLSQELEDGRRIISSNEDFVAFVPYAALSSFHTWIFPRRHCGCFTEITANELGSLAALLGDVLRRMRQSLNDPAYNLVIRSLSPPEAGVRYFHWYVSIIPRLAKAAGFELGTGMFINPSLPEESAAALRAVDPSRSPQP